MSDERVITPLAAPDDEALEASIRPKRLAEYIGQPAVREQMAIDIEAARRNRRRRARWLRLGGVLVAVSR